MKSTHNTFLNYFRPSIYLEDFDKLNIFSLANQGVRVLYCDLDNTLAPHFSHKPTQKAKDFLIRIKAQGIAIWVVSNNSKKRVKEFCVELLADKIIDGFIANAKKPLQYKIKRNMKKNNFSPEDAVVMGDQLITDVLVANRLGCRSILVQPLMDVVYELKTGNQKFQYLIEKLVYKLEKNNFLNLTEVNQDFSGGANEIL